MNEAVSCVSSGENNTFYTSTTSSTLAKKLLARLKILRQKNTQSFIRIQSSINPTSLLDEVKAFVV